MTTPTPTMAPIHSSIATTLTEVNSVETIIVDREHDEDGDDHDGERRSASAR